jgi:hypothetical protein
MSENALNAAAADTLGRRLDQLTAALKKQANRRPAVTRYALAAFAALGLLGAGYALRTPTTSRSSCPPARATPVSPRTR